MNFLSGIAGNDCGIYCFVIEDGKAVEKITISIGHNFTAVVPSESYNSKEITGIQIFDNNSIFRNRQDAEYGLKQRKIKEATEQIERAGFVGFNQGSVL